jgi:WD40 repeat protein
VAHAAGSEDGTVRVWELQSRQAVRILNSPEKAPVTGLLVLDRPPTLASGQGRRGTASASDSGASRRLLCDLRNKCNISAE